MANSQVQVAFLWNDKLITERMRQLHADLSVFTTSLTKDEQLEPKRNKKYGGYLFEAAVAVHSFQVHTR